MNAPTWGEVVHSDEPTHQVTKQLVMMVKGHQPMDSHEDIYRSAVNYASSVINPENQPMPGPTTG
jgi:hypothetical protein